EEVFTLPGIGRLVLWSIYQRDYPLTQSTILFIAGLFMAVNLAVDLLYGYLDPRIRYSCPTGWRRRLGGEPQRRLGAVRARGAAVPWVPCAVRAAGPGEARCDGCAGRE